MAWIVFSILLGALFITGAAFWLYAHKAADAHREAGFPETQIRLEWYRRSGLVAMITAAAIWILMTGLLTVRTVGEREVGIIYNFTGTIAGKREKGWVTIAPWQRMEKENIAIQHVDFVFGPDNSAVSKDQQDIYANLAINYAIDAENVLDLYRRVGPSWKTTIIESRVPQVFKEVTSTFQTPRITEERVALREQTRARLIQELEPYDIDVVDVFITNLGFSDLYSQAIEQKQKQVQDALQAEAKVKQVEAEARQRVAEAEGEAKSNVARARGDAAANRLRQRSLTQRLIQWEAIQKLNPNVEIIVCPPQSVCIPNSNVVPQP